MNGIHEVTGSIPVWSTNLLNIFLERFSQLYSKAIAAVADIVPAFGWREQLERDGGELVHAVERARPRRAHERLQFREGLFDGIEVGTVGRQQPQLGAYGFDRSADLGLFVDGEIIEDDHVAGPERGDQDLFDVGEKADVIDGTVEHGGRVDAVDA